MPKSTTLYWNPLSHEGHGGWTRVKGLEGIAEEITLSIDDITGEYTRLTRFLPGADTSPFGGKTHPYPEEVFIVSGRLYDQAFGLWLEAGYYASRHPEELHGPFYTDVGCVVLELSFPNRQVIANGCAYSAALEGRYASKSALCCGAGMLGIVMDADPVVEAICHQLSTEYGAHTILLYGSRANDTHTLDSDYDVAAFAPIDQVRRITGPAGTGYLDVFVYPESTLLDCTDELLRLRGAKILTQRSDEGVQFLQRLEGRFLAGPATLSPDEAKAVGDWLQKMAVRTKRADVEGNFRRVWLLNALLEDYFVLRQQWYQGPKKALAWMLLNDTTAHALFVEALVPGADYESIERLVQYVVDDA